MLRTRGQFADAVRALVPGARITQAPGIDPGRHLRGPSVLDLAEVDFGWVPRYSIEAGLADWLARIRTL